MLLSNYRYVDTGQPISVLVFDLSRPSYLLFYKMAAVKTNYVHSFEMSQSKPL